MKSSISVLRAQQLFQRTFIAAGVSLAMSSAAWAGCTYTVTNNWGTGFTGEIKVTNDTAATVNSWSVSWQESGATITNAWNATLSGSNPYTATSLSWNGTLAPKASASFGFQANGTAGAPKVNGSLCGVSNSSVAVSSTAVSSIPPSSKPASSSVISSSVKSSTQPSSVASSIATSAASSSVKSSVASSIKSSSSIASSVSNEGTWTFEENAVGFCSNGVIDTKHTGYTGTGFYDGENAVGSSVEWSVSAASAKTYSAQIRFGNGGAGARRATVVVNDVQIKTLDFPTNSVWTQWQTVNVDLPLKAGTNSVKVVAETADGLANIDNIAITGNGITPAACGTVVVPSGPALAFPTAEGYGMLAKGGRGGKVVAVTTLQDNVTGSLRWALQQHSGEPLTVVFRVSGIIDLKGVAIRAKRDNLTIAGQSAPGEGILIKGGKLNLGGSNNLIVRNLRARVGHMADGTFIEGGALGFENGSNAIFDHCTFGWSSEENMTVYDVSNLTIQWSIVHEGLYNAGHPKGARGYGAQWGGVTSTFHHNLLAHNVTRSPRFNGARSNDTDVLNEFVNNVIYNWGSKNFAYGGDIENNTHRVNVVNNYYKPGPAYAGNKSSLFVRSSYAATQGSKVALWYMQGNYMEGSANTGNNSNNYNGLDVGDYISALGSFDKNKAISKSLFSVKYPIKTESASGAYASVLAKAGAMPRDSVDKRIISEVTNGTAAGKGKFNNNANVGIIDDASGVGGFPTYKSATAPTDSDADGIPDQWENNNGLNANNAADGAKIHSSGYSWLELYLNGILGEKIQGVNY